jgi:hypothetical protein
MTVTTGQNGTNGKPINKGTILKLSVDHIKELKGEVMSYKDKIRDLERRIEAAKRGDINQDPTMTIKQEDGGMNIYNQQQQHQQQQAIHLIPNKGHERAGSAQFQQKFGKLNIACNNPQQQS